MVRLGVWSREGGRAGLCGTQSVIPLRLSSLFRLDTVLSLPSQLMKTLPMNESPRVAAYLNAGVILVIDGRSVALGRLY